MSGKAAGGTRVTDEREVTSGEPASQTDRMPNLPQWKWRTFPVFAAFVAGLLIDSIVNPPASDPGLALRIAALLGVGYVLAHVFVMNIIVARRIRARQRPRDSGEVDEWVDEVVHPDDEP